jgi:hypothetical protein
MCKETNRASGTTLSVRWSKRDAVWAATGKGIADFISIRCVPMLCVFLAFEIGHYFVWHFETARPQNIQGELSTFITELSN